MGAIRLRPDVEWCTVHGQVVALDMRTSNCVAINRTGAALWTSLTSGATQEQLERELVRAHGISPVTAARDVRAFLDELGERDLLSV